MAKGRNKGMQFERDTCKYLSLWISEGKRDDIFWRSAASGGRATNRAKQGKSTSNSAGDICATDRMGYKFLKKVTIELKRGYNDAHITNLVDTLKHVKKNPLLEFIDQAHSSAKQADTPFWMVIHSRDRKETLVYAPYAFVEWYESESPLDYSLSKRLGKFGMVKAPSLRPYGKRVCCFVFEELFRNLDPQVFK